MPRGVTSPGRMERSVAARTGLRGMRFTGVGNTYADLIKTTLKP